MNSNQNSLDTTYQLTEKSVWFTTADSGCDNAMLRISPDGFYVRGIKIEQDNEEARKVYDAFTTWLTWATLSQ